MFYRLEQAVNNPFSQFEEVARQNVNMFQQAMSAFSPFQMPGMGDTTAASPTAANGPDNAAAKDQNNADDLSSLKDKLADLEKQIDNLSKK